MTEPLQAPELTAQVKFRIWPLSTPEKMAKCAADCLKLGRRVTINGWFAPDGSERWDFEVSSDDPSHPTRATSEMKIIQQGSRIEAVTDEQVIDRYGQEALSSIQEG